MCDFDDPNNPNNSTTLGLLKAIEDLTKGGEKNEDGDRELNDPGNLELNDDQDQLMDEQFDPNIKRNCDDCGVSLAKSSKYRLKCVRCYNKIYSERNKEKFRLYHRKKYLAKREQILKTAKEHRDANKGQKVERSYSNCSNDLTDSNHSNDDKCSVCGEPAGNKVLLKGKCNRCYQRLYQRSYRGKYDKLAAIEQENGLTNCNSSFDAAQLECLLDTLKESKEVDKKCEEKNLTTSESEDEPSISQSSEVKEKRSCQECGAKVSSKSTNNRCKQCNKNSHHQINQISRICERNADDRKPCEICGLLLDNVPTNEETIKCPDCTGKEVMTKNEIGELDDNEKGLELIQYFSSLTSASNNESKPPEIKSRGNCETCGIALSIRGRLSKCRKCNKKEYKRMMRQKRREEQLMNPKLTCWNCGKLTMGPTRKCRECDLTEVKVKVTPPPKDLPKKIPKNPSKNPPKVSRKRLEEPKFCTDCSEVLHFMCKGDLCRKCNKKKYKKEARKRKREQKLANLKENEEQPESSSYLNQVISQFNIENCTAMDECGGEETNRDQSLLDYLISQKNSST